MSCGCSISKMNRLGRMGRVGVVCAHGLAGIGSNGQEIIDADGSVRDATPGPGGIYPQSWSFEIKRLPVFNFNTTGEGAPINGPAIMLVSPQNPGFTDGPYGDGWGIDNVVVSAPPPGTDGTIRRVTVVQWPPGPATAVGRRAAAIAAFEDQRISAATSQTYTRGKYEGGPYEPDLLQPQYQIDAVAERAFVDRVMVYINGPLMDPTPEVLARYDAAAGWKNGQLTPGGRGPVPVIFTNPNRLAAVIARGLRPADFPLTPKEQALSAAAVQRAYLPAGQQSQAVAQQALATSQAVTQAVTAAGGGQALIQQQTSSQAAQSTPAASSSTSASFDDRDLFNAGRGLVQSFTDRAGDTSSPARPTRSPTPEVGSGATGGLVALAVLAGLALVGSMGKRKRRRA